MIIKNLQLKNELAGKCKWQKSPFQKHWWLDQPRFWLETTFEKNEEIGGTNDEGENPKLASERQLTSLSTNRLGL